MNRFYDMFACQFHKDALDPLLKSILEPPHIGAAAVRSASLPYGVAVVDRSRPQVSDQGEASAPGDGEDGTVSDRSAQRSEEHTSELQSHLNLVCRLLLEKKKQHYD